ncbi:MAG: hypothetical protein R2867_00020 [Caldilineaceae bacterium]
MGQHEGLHLIPGHFRRFPEKMPDPIHTNHTLRVPQIGWNQLHQKRRCDCWKGCQTAPMPILPTATTVTRRRKRLYWPRPDYGVVYPTIVRYKNAWGIQPHPELSHTVGLRILKNFMRMVVLNDLAVDAVAESLQPQP